MDVMTAYALAAIVVRAMAHGRWTEVEARGVLEAWRKSGLPPELVEDAGNACAGQRGVRHDGGGTRA